ncbi:MAG: transposase family protein [Kiritimatiellae bacterium]|nr:transposase family protein [Kiritimatiellia bacterium]
MGCPCTSYFKANVEEWLEEYRTCVAHVSDDVATHLLSMSASTMDRLLKGVKRDKPGSMQRNRRSGRNYELLKAIECKSGELVMGCNVEPGDVQTDTIAHCGGDMGGNFWWTLTATDRKTQWTELQPVWNRGVYAARDALDAAMRRIPFEVWSVHHDNGKEYVNNAIAEWRGDRWKMPSSRSRPYRKNDNAHVEQKNGSVVRTLLGESRLDRRELEPELRRLCEDYSGYRNFCVPCKMLVAKTKRKDGKGFSCRYDKPRTPYARVLADPAVPEDAKNALRRRKEKLNCIELYQRILKRLRRIRRMQDLPDGDSPGPVGSALAPCGATPSGTAFASEAGWNNTTSHQPNPSEKCPAFDERNVQAFN